METPDRSDPMSEFAAGVRAMAEEAGLCGAYNPETLAPHYVVCRLRGTQVGASWHTGKHDDGWQHFGDREAASDQNAADAVRHRREILASA